MFLRVLLTPTLFGTPFVSPGRKMGRKHLPLGGAVASLASGDEADFGAGP